MKYWIDGFFMAWGMFLRIPVPVNAWNENSRAKMLACFPLIGAMAGGVEIAAYYFFRWAPAGILALILCAVPWLVTGFMHLDGFMDVCDAVLSSRKLERRREILKDSHCGSFAVISMVLLALAQWSAFFSAAEIKPFVLLMIPVCTRACAYFALSLIKPMDCSQYAGMKRDKTATVVCAVFLALSITLPVFTSGLTGLAVVGSGLVYALACLWGCRNLGGINGDISGFALSLGEMAGYLLMAVI